MSKEERTQRLHELLAVAESSVRSVQEMADTMESAELALAYDALGTLNEVVRSTMDLYRQLLVEAMRKAGLKTATVQGADGSTYAVEVGNKSVRKNVRRDELVTDVERLANIVSTRLDPVTGEYASVEETRLRLLKSAFRFEPRWTEISKLGINDDEYCEKDWTQTVTIQKAVTL